MYDLSWFLHRIRDRDLASFFYMWMSIFLTPFVEEDVFSLRMFFDIFVKKPCGWSYRSMHLGFPFYSVDLSVSLSVCLSFFLLCHSMLSSNGGLTVCLYIMDMTPPTLFCCCCCWRLNYLPSFVLLCEYEYYFMNSDFDRDCIDSQTVVVDSHSHNIVYYNP